jgi:hypothetical protein
MNTPASHDGFLLKARAARDPQPTFDGPGHNPFGEVFTNKIKVIERSAHGYRSLERYRLKVPLACGCRHDSRDPKLLNSR